MSSSDRIYLLRINDDLIEGKGSDITIAVHTSKEKLMKMASELPTDMSGKRVSATLWEYPITDTLNREGKHVRMAPFKSYYYNGRNDKWYDNLDDYVKHLFD